MIILSATILKKISGVGDNVKNSIEKNQQAIEAKSTDEKGEKARRGGSDGKYSGLKPENGMKKGVMT